MADTYEHLANHACSQCAGLVRMLTAASVDIENAQTEILALLRRNRDLKERRRREEAQRVTDEQVQRIFDLYCVIEGKTRGYKLGPKRHDVIEKFLDWGSDYTELEVKRAFMAIPLEKERQPEWAHTYKLEFVLRDESNFERFRDRYVAHWGQFEYTQVDRERLDRFAQGEDPASRVSGDTNVVPFDKKRSRRAA